MLKLDDLAEISGPENGPFALKLMIYTILLATGVCTSLLHNYFLGIFVTGIAIAHGVELQHQILHGTAFRNKIISHLVGFLLGFPMLISYSDYQHNHLIHHRNVGTEGDSEFFEFNNLNDGYGLVQKILSFFLIGHFRDFFKTAVIAFTRFSDLKTTDKSTGLATQIEHIIMLLSLLISVVISAWFNDYRLLTIWILSLVFVAAPLHTIIELPEHFRCDNKSSNILRNTRSIDSNAFAVWFTNGNNYHIEHHTYPLVRPEKLARVHRQLSGKSVFTNRSYAEFFLQLWSK